MEKTLIVVKRENTDVTQVHRSRIRSLQGRNRNHLKQSASITTPDDVLLKERANPCNELLIRLPWPPSKILARLK